MYLCKGIHTNTIKVNSILLQTSTMKYFEISHAIENKDTNGVYPQVQKIICNTKVDAPSSIYSINQFKIQTSSPDLNYLVVENNTQLTDILSTSMISSGLVVSKKFNPNYAIDFVVRVLRRC